MVNYVLIGFSAAGKTTIGKLLAKQTGQKYLSTDALVEHKAGMDCAKIIETRGKGYFSSLENQVIKDLIEERNVIIDIGSGGSYRNPEDTKLLGTIVFLKVSVKELSDRVLESKYKKEYITNVKGVAEKDHMKYILEKLRLREPIYTEIADLIIDTTNKTPKEIVELILQK